MKLSLYRKLVHTLELCLIIVCGFLTKSARERVLKVINCTCSPYAVRPRDANAMDTMQGIRGAMFVSGARIIVGRQLPRSLSRNRTPKRNLMAKGIRIRPTRAEKIITTTLVGCMSRMRSGNR